MELFRNALPPQGMVDRVFRQLNFGQGSGGFDRDRASIGQYHGRVGMHTVDTFGLWVSFFALCGQFGRFGGGKGAGREGTQHRSDHFLVDGGLVTVWLKLLTFFQSKCFK